MFKLGKYKIFSAALLAIALMAAPAIAKPCNKGCHDRKERGCHQRRHKRCKERNCYSYSELQAAVRKDEAFRLAVELNSKVTNALDKVLLSNGPGDPNFEDNVNFVLCLQEDQNNMDITIDIFNITNAEQFRAAWAGLTQFYKYRKRSIVQYVITDYKDDGCEREISLYGIGQSFGILDYLPGQQPPGQLPGPPWHTTLNFLDFDRFVITTRIDKNNVARVVGLSQITESSFPMLDGAVIVSSPLAPDARANLIPVAPGCGESRCASFP